MGLKMFFKYIIFLLLIIRAIDLIRRNKLGTKKINSQNMLILLVKGPFSRFLAFPPHIASIPLTKYDFTVFLLHIIIAINLMKKNEQGMKEKI